MNTFLEKVDRDVGKRKWRDEGRELERKGRGKEGLGDGSRGVESRVGVWRTG